MHLLEAGLRWEVENYWMAVVVEKEADGMVEKPAYWWSCDWRDLDPVHFVWKMDNDDTALSQTCKTQQLKHCCFSIANN